MADWKSFDENTLDHFVDTLHLTKDSASRDLMNKEMVGMVLGVMGSAAVADAFEDLVRASKGVVQAIDLQLSEIREFQRMKRAGQ